MVQYSLIRQLVSNNELDATDHHAFRRIFDLGELGLRSVLGHQNFTEDESRRIKSYLANTTIDVLLDQRFTISSTKDIINYNKSVAEYANIGLKQLEMEQRAALMRLTHKRMEQEMGIEQSTEVYAEDTELMEYLQMAMRKNASPECPSFIDIKVEPVK
jgi:hypothetical protein